MSLQLFVGSWLERARNRLRLRDKTAGAGCGSAQDHCKGKKFGPSHRLIGMLPLVSRVLRFWSFFYPSVKSRVVTVSNDSLIRIKHCKLTCTTRIGPIGNGMTSDVCTKLLARCQISSVSSVVRKLALLTNKPNPTSISNEFGPVENFVSQ